MRTAVHDRAGVLTLRVQRIENDIEIRQPATVEQALLDGVGLDALERVERGVLRMHAPAHSLPGANRAEVVEVGLAAAGGARRADVAVDVEPGAEDGRVADAARDLPRQAAGGGHAADLPLRVDPIAIDRAVQMM